MSLTTRFCSIVLMVALLGSAGCQTSGREYAADVYSTSAVNQRQEARTIQIIAVLPAQIAIDNTEKKRQAEIMGTLLGAVAGSVAGYNITGGSSGTGAVAGGVAGGVLGNAAGSLIDSKSLVSGVTVTYSENNKIYTSTQVGLPCQFQPGLALLISTSESETRVQPNAVCPQP